MPEPNEISADLTPLAGALRELAPAAGGLSRDRMLFEAGRAAARPACPWAWPVTAGGFAMLAVAFAGVLAFSEPRVQFAERERLVYVHDSQRDDEPPPPAVSSPRPEMRAMSLSPAEDVSSPDVRRMAELRRDVLRWGVEMLPEPRSASAPAQPPRDREIENLIRPTPGAYASPYLLPFRPPSIRSGDDE